MGKLLSELQTKAFDLQTRVALLGAPYGNQNAAGPHDVSGGRVEESKTTVTMSGWRTEHGNIEYGKTKPITRGQGTYFYLKVGGKERRFRTADAGAPAIEKLQRAVEKLGLPFKFPKPGDS